MSRQGKRARRQIAEQCLRGVGVEIGAGSKPWPLPVGASVTYVDHVDAAEGMRIYAHHDADRCVTPDRICDAEQMEGFEKESLDFIVSSHVLEHLKNPAGAIVEHMKLLKPGGFWVAAVPNMKCTFDAGRMETSPGHFILDMEDGGESTMSEHRKSWASVEPPHRPPGDYMHVHCWTPEGMTGCLSRLSCIENTFSFEITEHGAEFFIILKKRNGETK